MQSDLNGKVVLITGASTGIGAAAARAFARLGSRVIVHYNASRQAAESVASDIRSLGSEAHLVGGDVTHTANVQQDRRRGACRLRPHRRPDQQRRRDDRTHQDRGIHRRVSEQGAGAQRHAGGDVHARGDPGDAPPGRRQRDQRQLDRRAARRWRRRDHLRGGKRVSFRPRRAAGPRKSWRTRSASTPSLPASSRRRFTSATRTRSN